MAIPGPRSSTELPWTTKGKSGSAAMGTTIRAFGGYCSQIVPNSSIKSDRGSDRVITRGGDSWRTTAQMLGFQFAAAPRDQVPEIASILTSGGMISPFAEREWWSFSIVGTSAPRGLAAAKSCKEGRSRNSIPSADRSSRMWNNVRSSRTHDPGSIA
jgi:hypothetical protein